MHRFGLFVFGLLMVINSIANVNSYTINVENATATEADHDIENELVVKAETRLKCPENFVLLGEDCFYISQTKGDVMNATEECSMLSGDLAILRNQNEMEELNKHLISLETENAFRIDGSYVVATSGYVVEGGAEMPYTKWADGYPKKSSPVMCANLEKHVGEYFMIDSDCFNAMPFICKAKPVKVELSCPEKFSLVGDKCYLVEKTNKIDRFKAKISCLAMGAELTKVENEEEMEALNAHLNSLNVNPNLFWIAGSDLHSEGNFYWDQVDNKMTYTKWAPGQPSDTPNSHYCVLLEPTDTTYYMNDHSCYDIYGYICEGKPKDAKEVDNLRTEVTIKFKKPQLTENCPNEFSKVGNKCYFVQKSEKSNWHQAYRACRKMHSDMLTIEGAEELELLGDHLRDLDEDPAKLNWALNEFWTAANDLGSEGIFHWQSNGEVMTYNKWFGDSPNNYNGNEHCANLKYYDDGFYMNDNNCDQHKNFICETELLKPVIAQAPVVKTDNELSVTTCTEMDLLKLNFESQAKVLDMLIAQQKCGQQIA